MPRCAYLPCNREFVPVRKTQRFCLGLGCKDKFHHAHRRNDPHACPWCTVWHDPEERAILDALEMLIREWAFLPPDSPNEEWVVEAKRIESLIVRRRAILAGPPPSDQVECEAEGVQTEDDQPE